MANGGPETNGGLGSDHGKYLPERELLPNLPCFPALERQFRYRNLRSKPQAVHVPASTSCLEQQFWQEKWPSKVLYSRYLPGLSSEISGLRWSDPH